MTSAILVPVLALAALADWIVAVTLVRAALQRPRITSLTERAFAATVVALVLTVSSVLAYASSFSTVDAELVRFVARSLYLLLALLPPVWLLLYYTGRFGGPE